jgi:hypothetical protein
MQRLCTGAFECPTCCAIYQADGDPESELICSDCNEFLEPLVENDEEEL